VVNENIDALIELALAEDLGDGDHTTLATIPADTAGAARLLVKQPGVLAGVELAQAVMRRVDPALNVKVFIQDGAQVVPGDVAFTVMGASRSILIAERTVLNFMQRMSGIATLTRRFVQAMEGTRCRVLDTRKTTPGLRHVEKWAVRIGGGVNHRMGLYDMVMIKDNHADMAGGISRAIAAVKAYQHQLGRELPIEVEVRNMKELEEVLITGGVDRIMLDNFGLDDLRLAVKRIRRRVATEASGGITLENAHDYAATGVDYISVGALTHSVGSLDLSLKAM
jgi:nicotinate-nucleotide pyrophosphorylase (carboxylating)